MKRRSTLTTNEARSFYDRLGARQDSQAFYEDVATRDLTRNADFGQASFVIELGCGTGRFAEGLLDGFLPANARWLGVDLSRTMVDLARRRTARFGSRAEVHQSDGSPRIDLPDAVADRFVSNFVLDLLSEDQIREVVAEAHRLLRPGGLLCLTSLGHGTTAITRGVEWVWNTIHSIRPSLVGGCRPLRLGDFVAPPHWSVRHRTVVTPYGLAAEVLIASREPFPVG